MRLLAVALGAGIALWGCARRLGPEVLARHPKIPTTIPRPTIVEQSGETPPWVHGQRDPEGLEFIGQASGDTREDARRDAVVDLSQSVARYISVDVNAQSESVMEQRTIKGQTEASQSAHSETQARQRSVRDIEPEDEYWEKLVEGAQKRAIYRYYVRTRLGAKQ